MSGEDVQRPKRINKNMDADDEGFSVLAKRIPLK